MSVAPVPQIERNIARFRLILTLVALVAVFVDPTDSVLPTKHPVHRSWFSIDPVTHGVLSLHLVYGLSIYLSLVTGLLSTATLGRFTVWIDVLFGAVIAFFTQGASSPFYAFFVFAVVVGGIRSGFQRTLVITGVSVLLYLLLNAVTAPAHLNFYVMRPVYLAIIGYLVAYLAQQRLNLESEIEALASEEERTRIARDLHDGWAQALAGIDLRIESCRELIHRGETTAAAADLGDLQTSVHREYDELRAYMRELAGREHRPAGAFSADETSFTVVADFSAPGPVVDHVLQILREGVSNVTRHAGARRATLHASAANGLLSLRLDDDGRGFPSSDDIPWSIRSRVDELGGNIRSIADTPGAHLRINVPLRIRP